MKYLTLPISLLKFWYPESLVVFFRTWKNALFYLEEDLAVGLMFKLLFVPLFHDSTLLGRMLSFGFRSFRIALGLFAFTFTTLIFLTVCLFWLAIPVLAFILEGDLGWILRICLFSGTVLFVHHLISHPQKQVWQVKNSQEIFSSSFLSKRDINLQKLLSSYEVKNLLLYLETTPDKFYKLQSKTLKEEIAEKAWHLGRKVGARYLYPQHFFVAYLSLVPQIEDHLLKLGLTLTDFVDVIDFFQRREQHWRLVYLWDEDFKVKHLRGVNRGWVGIPTPTLDSVSLDITKMAASKPLPDFVGREEQVKRVVDILSQEKGKNVLLLGEPGSGREALVKYLAKLIISGDAPRALATKRLVGIETTKLLAGITNQGDLAQRIKDVFEEVKSSGNIVLYIEEIQDLGIGEVGGRYNLYSLILPFLESSDFQFIAITEEANLSRVLEKNKSFASLFTKVELPPASLGETIDILKNRSIEYERYRHIKISLLALKKIAQLTKAYIHDLVLPDAALRVLEESLVENEAGWVKSSVVEKVVQDRSAVPIVEASSKLKKNLLNLEGVIAQQVIDQEVAVKVVAQTLRRSAAHLRDMNRPIGSFLFVGPTGVGKTELAKILNKVYFSGKGNFLRLDMSEYQTTEAIDKLIGQQGEEGYLTEAIYQHPYSLILLDELEKAEEKVLNLFLQVFDDGRLTSGSGKTVDFTNTIIIATSNAASLLIARGLGVGKSVEDLKGQVYEELLKIFHPELVNRFDEVVIFKTLSPTALQSIIKLKLASLGEKLKDQGYKVEFAPELIGELAKKGFDPVMGARPLRRLIQDTLEAKLSELILQEKLPKGEKFLADQKLLIG